MRVLACLAEGLGIRATARVFEVDPNTVLQWLVEAAEQLGPFPPISSVTCTWSSCNSTSCTRCCATSKPARSATTRPSSAWSAPPPGCGRRWTPRASCWWWSMSARRTLAMAQRVVHQVTQVLAPGCVPLFLTDGLKDYRHGIPDPFWLLDATRTAPGQRAAAQAALDAAARAALCAGGEVVPASAHRRGQAPRGVRHPAGHRAGPGGDVAGRSIPPLSNGSTSTSASAWRRSGAGSTRCARAKRACGISWPCSRSITTLCCPTPAYASPC